LIQVTLSHSLPHTFLSLRLALLAENTKLRIKTLHSSLQPGCLSLAPSLTQHFLTHNNNTIIHVHSGASPALHTNIKAPFLGVIIVLDGMILHTTHDTKLSQPITIIMAIRNITPASASSSLLKGNK